MKKVFTSLSLSFFPVLAFAVTTYATDALSFIKIMQNVVDAAVPFVISLGVLVFLYGIFQFITSAGDEEVRTNAKHLIIWGVIGLFVMVAVWGLVHILVGTFFPTGVSIGEPPPGTYKIPVTGIN